MILKKRPRTSRKVSVKMQVFYPKRDEFEIWSENFLWGNIRNLSARTSTQNLMDEQNHWDRVRMKSKVSKKRGQSFFIPWILPLIK